MWSGRSVRDPARIMMRGPRGGGGLHRRRRVVHAPLRAIVRLRIRESVRAVLLRAIDDETWDFALAEQAFGREKPWPAAFGDVVADSDEELWLRGFVDRIDNGHDNASVRVIDYKRSKSTVQSSMGSVGGAAIQVPLYAAVAARNLGRAATGIYLPIQPRDLAAATAARPKQDRGRGAGCRIVRRRDRARVVTPSPSRREAANSHSLPIPREPVHVLRRERRVPQTALRDGARGRR